MAENQIDVWGNEIAALLAEEKKKSLLSFGEKLRKSELRKFSEGGKKRAFTLRNK